ncbi:hypothetical protein PUN28_010080 [Cardiocondyla obscurior]|uniref:Uncharacterized protein n=1 Tax=Cardiocondyla obscurior TaxID=286306 RepID=A0AAW2FRY9_9HYME
MTVSHGILSRRTVSSPSGLQAAQLSSKKTSPTKDTGTLPLFKHLVFFCTTARFMLRVLIFLHGDVLSALQDTTRCSISLLIFSVKCSQIRCRMSFESRDRVP